MAGLQRKASSKDLKEDMDDNRSPSDLQMTLFLIGNEKHKVKMMKGMLIVFSVRSGSSRR